MNKDLLIIDTKYTLYEYSNSNFKISLQEGLKQIAEHFKLAFVVEYQYDEVYETIKKSLDESLSLDSRLQFVLDQFFGKDSILANKFTDYVETKTKSSSGRFIFEVENLFNFADLTYLKVHYEVVFYSAIRNPLKRLLLNVFLSNLIDVESLYFEKIPNLANWKPSKVFTVSQRPNHMKKRVISILNPEQIFNYKKNFVYFTNPYLPIEIIEKFNIEANELQLFWETFNLKLLSQKLLLVKSFASNELKESKLKFVGVFFNKKILRNLIIKNFVQDFYPVVFLLHDPLSNRYNENISIFYAKAPQIAKRHHKYELPEIAETCSKISEIHDNLKQLRNASIVDINNTKDYMQFVSRILTSKLFDDIFKDPEFLLELKALSSTIKISFPKTRLLESSNISDSSGGYQRILNIINQAEMSFPLILKSDSTISNFDNQSHILIIISSIDKVVPVFETNIEQIKKLGNLIIQELVTNVDGVAKVYQIFDRISTGFINSLKDDTLGESKIIDGYMELKNPLQREIDETTVKVSRIISQALRNKNFLNFGFDLVRQVGTDNYFVFDFNADGGNWHKHLDKKMKPIDVFQSGILSLLTK
jgi:hypothetical protein